MTLAALSPLYTWWLLFFALLTVIRLGALRVARRQERPWPPPVVLSDGTSIVSFGEPVTPAQAARLAEVYRAAISPWAAPDERDMAHTYIWTPSPEWDRVAWAFSRPPHPWTRVNP